MPLSKMELGRTGMPRSLKGYAVLLCLVLAFLSWAPITRLHAADDNSTSETFQASQRDLGNKEVSEPETAQEIDRQVPGASPDFQKGTTQATFPSEAIQTSIFKKALSEWTSRLQPNQGGIVWLGFLVTLLVAIDFKRLVSWRNADLLLLVAPSILFVDVIRFELSYDDPVKLSLFGLIFLGIFLFTVLLLFRALVRAFASEEAPWTPSLPPSALIALLILLFACNALLALGRAPDDCGYYTNLGARRMLDTGAFPYGDPLLRGGAAATYGPVLYAVHIPFQLALSPADDDSVQNQPSDEGISVDASDKIVEPPILATKLTLLFFHLLGVVGLVLIGRKLAGAAVGWSLACLYCASPFVQGLGGEELFISGMTFISHIAPAAITIVAFALLNRPFAAGVMLGAAAGILFYPAFFFPLWFGYYFWQGKDWRKFTAGFVVVCAVIGMSVLLLTDSPEGGSVLQTIYESTVGHQESKDAYGSSTFSFWGTHPRWAAFWQEPLIQDSYLLKPSFLVFALLVGASFFMARDRTVTQFAFLTAAIAIAIQLWKSHAGGTYVEWYLPFFLVGLLAQKNPLGHATENMAEPATKE